MKTKNSEKNLELMQFSIDRASVGVFWIDPDARFVYVNDAVGKSLGYSKEELLKMTVHDIDPKFPKKVWPKHWKDIKKRRSFSFESIHKRKDGSTFPVEISVNYFKHKTKEYNLAFAKEITGRKHAETDLRVSEEKYRVITESSPIGLYSNDLKGNFLYGNKAAESIIGYTARELVGKNFLNLKLLNTQDLKKAAKLLALNVLGKGTGPDEFTLNRKDGTKAVVEITTRMINVGGKRIVMGLVQDITLRKKTEDALKANEERYRTLFENSPISLWESDSSEVKNYLNNLKSKGIKDFNRYFDDHPEDLAHCSTMIKVLDVNQATLDVFKAKTKKEFWGGISRVFRKETFREYKKELIAMAEKKTSFNYTAPVKTLKGKKLLVRVKGVVAPGHEKTWSRALISITDITELEEAKKSAESLNKELRKVNKKLSQLVVRDPETDLFTHHYLSEVIEPEFYRAKRYAHPISVLMMDIDYFKSINDVYGHPFGDLVLRQFAKQLKNFVRKHDFTFRYGGEEFLVVAPRTDLKSATNLARRILDAINLYNFGNKEHSIKIKLSIAVASYPENSAAKAMDLIKFSEKMLTKTKEHGGNRVYSTLDLKTKISPKAEEDADVKVLKKKIDKLNKRANQGLLEAISAFAKTLELKDPHTGDHVEKTVRYAIRIAQEMNLAPDEIERIRKAAILHDLGKIGISDKILRKKKKLTKKEWLEIKKHPQIGVDIIRPIQYLHDVIPLILGHHERWDGKGYPHGLKGEEIPIGARVVAVADVYQALTSDRPYRKAFSMEEAVKIIKQSSGTYFDPQIVKAFLRIWKKHH